MERILVTGATGFVGRHLVRDLLDEGHAVAALVRPSSDTSRLDPRAVVLPAGETTQALAEGVAGFRPDAAVHTASQVVAQHRPDDIAPMIEANLLFGCRLLDALLRCGTDRLVNFGTNWQHYGGPAYRPVCLYAATKQAFEDLAAYYTDACGLRMVTLKLTDTYGAEDLRAKILPQLIRAALNGTELAMSPGGQRVSFVHVADVAQAVRVALRRTADNPPGAEGFVVAGEEVIGLRAFVARVEQATGRPLAIAWGARPYREREVMEPWVEPRLPGWAPRIGLDQGIAEVVAALR